MAKHPTPLTGRGLLARTSGSWLDFLSEHGQDTAADGCFVARNFVLDEGVLTARAQSYEQAGAVDDHRTYAAWKTAHWAYLQDRVFQPSDDDGPPTVLDPDDPDEVPETFLHIDPQSPFLGTDPTKVLVRLEELSFIAEMAGEQPDRLRSVVEGVLAGGSSRTANEPELNEILRRWFEELDQRPVFAAFWDELEDLFGADPSQDQADWADTLRDRLGLTHLNPPARLTDLDLLVFRYEVKILPRIKGIGGKKRALVTPTVLDGTFLDAFCPSPRGSTTGHVVNLDANAGILRREVLHPRFAFRASHLWRLGTVKRGVLRDQLPDARAFHLLAVRDATGRVDYADGTDEDIF